MDDLVVSGAEIELSPAPGATWRWVAPVRLRLEATHPILCQGKNVVLEPEILAAAPQAAGQQYTDGPYSVPGTIASVTLAVDASTLSETSSVGGARVATAATEGTFEAVCGSPAMTTSSPPDPDKSFPKKGQWKVVSTNQSVAVSGKPAPPAAATAGVAGGGAVGRDAAASAESEELTWVAIELKDDQGEPLAGHSVAITLPDERRLVRRLNQKGAVRVSGIRAAGDCTVEWLGGPAVGATATRKSEAQHWVAIELKDEQGEPLAGHRVAITLPDETRIERRLNQRGAVRVDGIQDAGECTVQWLSGPEERAGGLTNPVARESVVLQVIDSYGEPLSGCELALTLPGESRSLRRKTRAKGALRVDGISQAGQCLVELIQASELSLEEEASKEGGAPGTVGRSYTIREGDTLFSLAQRLFLLDLDGLWAHPQNQSLREHSPDGGILPRGQRLYIPPEALSTEVATSARHCITVQRPRAKLSLLLEAPSGEPLADCEWELSFEPQPVRGKTNSDGRLEAELPPNAGPRVPLAAWPPAPEAPEGVPPGQPYRWLLEVGGLAALSEMAGVQARLQNLGYYSGAVDGAGGPKTRAALRCFQRSQALSAGGELTAETRERLGGQYGC